MKFNNVELTQDSILKARQHYITLTERCAEAVKDGNILIDNTDDFLTFQQAEAAKFEAGDYDHTLGFAQRAYYIQTGADVTLLP